MATQDAFLAHIRTLLGQKEQERDALNAQLQGVQRALIAANAELAKLKAVLELYEDFSRDASVRKVGAVADSDTSGTPIGKGSVARTSYQIMRDNGGRMMVPELMQQLRAAGKLHGLDYHADYSTVYRTLARDRRFRKVGRGEFEVVPEPDSIVVATGSTSTTAAR